MSLQIKWSYIFILFFSFFLLSGCGSDNSQTGVSASPGVNESNVIKTLGVSGGNATATSSGEEIEIRIKAMTKDNVLVSSGNIIAQYLDSNNNSGELTPSRAPVIDGFATFHYVSPKNIQEQIDAGNTQTSFRFFDQNNTKVFTDVVIKFDTSAQTDGESDPIAKLILSDTIINVAGASDTKVITIRGLKSDNTLVKKGKVIIKYPDTNGIDVGTVPSEVDIIDGIGTFTYTAPSNLVKASTVSPVLFTIEDGTNDSVIAQLTVSFLNATVSPTLSVNNGPITITEDAFNVKVNVLAVDSAGVPLKYGTIKLEYPTGTNIGHFAQSEALIENGIASFDYTGPDPLIARSSASFTFIFKENSSKKTTWNVSFRPDVEAVPPAAPVISSILLSEVAFTVTDSAETRNIYVYAFDSRGVGISEGEVQIKYPSTAVTTGIDAGSTPATVAIKDGIGSFTYTAPIDVSKAVTISPATFRVQSSMNASVYKEFAVSYAPSSGTAINPTINIQGQNPLSIKNDAQEVSVTMLVVDSNNNRPLSEGTILVQYPLESNVGIFKESEVAISNGQVVFHYVAPSNLSDLIDAGTDNTTFIFVYKENQINPKPLNIKFEPNTFISSLAINQSTTTISKDQQKHTVVVNALDSNGNFVLSGDINVKFPVAVSNGTDLGSFASLSVPIINGQATFDYTGPLDVLKTSGAVAGAQTFTFSDAANNVTDINWDVTYIADVPSLLMERGTVTLTQSSQKEIIKVFAFDSHNVALTSGTVEVSYPNTGVNIGQFTQNKASIVNGVATFTYNGPTPLVDIADQTFTFTYKQNSAITAQLSVVYQPISTKIDDIYIATDNDVNITKNSEIIDIDIRVNGADGNPFTTGEIKINYPQNPNHLDIGSFNELNLTVDNNGRAHFLYKAPSNIANRSDSFTFSFYHTSDPTLTTDFKVTLDPDPNQTVITSYNLIFTSTDGTVAANIESMESYSAIVRDTEGDQIEGVTFTVENLNPLLGSLLDENALPQNPLIVADVKNLSFVLETNTISGLIPLKITAEFTDVNGNPSSIENVFNIVVFSGPPTSISISYASTDIDTANAKFIEHMVVTVVDKYFNPINTQPAISAGAIIGYVGGTNPANYMYYEPDETITAELRSSTDPDSLYVSGFDPDTSSAIDFDNIDYDNDILAVFGKGYTYDVSGKWDFSGYTSAHTLNLVDKFDGVDTQNLGFAVGNNQRAMTCNPGQEKVGFVQVEDSSQKLDQNGIAKISITYDYYLVGKEIVFWTNILGFQANLGTTVRIGESQKHTLRGHGLTPVPEKFSIPKGATNVIKRVRFNITGTSEWYRNAFVGATVDYVKSVPNSVIVTTPSACSFTTANTQISDTDGITYWEFDVNSTDTATDGSVKLSNAVVGGEGF
jgi:hypothetical protein